MHDKSLEFLKLQELYMTQIRLFQKYLTGLEYRKQVSFLRGMKRHVIEEVISLGLQDEELAFLSVLQHSLRSEEKNIPLTRQMTFVRYWEGEYERIGTYNANLGKVSDIEKNIPFHYPYYLLGVHLNMENVGLNAKDATQKILDKEERPFSLAETVSLAMHRPELLKDCILLACGSQYGEKDANGKTRSVPCIQLYEGKPTIMWKDVERKFPQYISPSCKKRLAVTILSSARTIIQGRPWRTIGPI